MRALTFVAALLALLAGFAGELLAKDVNVRGYTRKDGTYVQPHVRSAPDGIPSNNYSFPGNTNPYTGKVAPGNADTYLKPYDSAPAAPLYAPTPAPSYGGTTPGYRRYGE